MTDAYIIDALRTPVGRRGGALSEVHPADLAAFALTALFDRNDVDPAAVGDLIMGCANQIGSQAANVARTAWLSANLPEHVPATTVDRRCGSAQQAIEFAAQGIMSGVHELVVAGGVESMSIVPIGSPAAVGEEAGFGGQFSSEGWKRRYGDRPVSQFNGAEMLVRRSSLSRGELDHFAVESHRRADRAWTEGRFDREVVPYGGITRDEGIRANVDPVKLASLEPLIPGGSLTAATSSQISDASSMVLLASELACKRFGLTPRARVHASAVVGSDPILMLHGPVPATQRVLERSGLHIDDISLFEVNEAFASVVLTWAKETGGDLQRTNVNGGAIALGHPLGATGARLMTTLLHELERTSGRFGLQVMCEGSGTANATIIECLESSR